MSSRFLRRFILFYVMFWDFTLDYSSPEVVNPAVFLVHVPVPNMSPRNNNTSHLNHPT